MTISAALSFPAGAPGRRDGAVDARNMALLAQLRWIAVAGQIVTIAVVRLYFGIDLPLLAMASVLALLAALNLGCRAVLRFRPDLASRLLAPALAIDILALTAQLALSGGPSNPFVWLWLLQVTLGATMLERPMAAVLAALASLSFPLVAWLHLPLRLPVGTDHLDLYILGSFFCLTLVAVLTVVFVTRANRIRRDRDAELSAMRQRHAEQEQIIRMGLLASGAAHELGTPLSSLAVILGDWRDHPALAAHPDLAEDLAVMQRAVGRCKSIVTGILAASGEARAEGLQLTTVHRFVSGLLRDWAEARSFTGLQVDNAFGADLVIVSDETLTQMVTNVLDNALEVSPARIALRLDRDGDDLRIVTRDYGRGFAPAVLADLGRPYISTKGSPGRGLGLFLAGNVARKLGGNLSAQNRADGQGAEVTVRLPLAALTPGQGAGGQA